MPHPHDISNSSIIVCSRLCFTQNMIIWNLILSFVEVEHIVIVARFSYCITGILIYSPLHIKNWYILKSSYDYDYEIDLFGHIILRNKS